MFNPSNRCEGERRGVVQGFVEALGSDGEDGGEKNESDEVDEVGRVVEVVKDLENSIMINKVISLPEISLKKVSGVAIVRAMEESISDRGNCIEN